MATKKHTVQALLKHRPVTHNKNRKKTKPETKGEYEYLVRWDGVDPKTGKPWPDTWEPTERIDVVTLESYYASRLARRTPTRPKGSPLAYTVRWSSDGCTLVPLTDPGPSGSFYGSSPPAPANDTGSVEKRKRQYDSPNHLNEPPDATSSPVFADKQPVPWQTELSPMPRRPLDRLRSGGSRLPRANKRRVTTSDRLMTSSPSSPSTTECMVRPIDFTKSRSHVNETPYHETAPPNKCRGLADSSPVTTAPKKRRRLCDSMKG